MVCQFLAWPASPLPTLTGGPTTPLSSKLTLHISHSPLPILYDMIGGWRELIFTAAVRLLSFSSITSYYSYVW